MKRRRRLARLLRTVRHLRLRQIAWRIWFRSRPTPRVRRSPAPARRSLTGSPSDGLRRSCLEPPRAFTFLGETRTFDEKIAWLDADRGKLWTYNLHYFDYLDDAGRCSNGNAATLIDEWIEANPYATGDGWEPYPTSLRIVNWIRRTWRDERVDRRTLDSLALQVRWLARNVEYHILANHLFTNLKALLFAGLYFGDREGERWLRLGLSGVALELDEQILPDGGHFERSPMYQATLLNDLLDLIELGDASPAVDSAIVDGWRDVARAMLGWLVTMTHPDGGIAFFNDAAFGIAPTTAELGERAERLGIARPGPEHSDTVHLAPSGYVRARRGAATLIADVAPIGPDHQPGHAHADTLSFELSVGAQRVIVNSGTSTYVPGDMRDAQRRTRSHSTVEVDATDSSETWSGFRVGRRARILDVSVEDDGQTLTIEGAHDGYVHLEGHVVHRRRWTLDAKRLVVADELAGRWHSATVRYFLHPDVHADDDGRLSVDGRTVARWIVTDGDATLVRSHWYPRFGHTRPNLCLCVDVHPDATSCRLEFEFEPVTARPPSPPRRNGS